jgi:hypothetical protein
MEENRNGMLNILYFLNQILLKLPTPTSSINLSIFFEEETPYLNWLNNPTKIVP